MTNSQAQVFKRACRMQILRRHNTVYITDCKDQISEADYWCFIQHNFKLGLAPDNL